MYVKSFEKNFKMGRPSFSRNAPNPTCEASTNSVIGSSGLNRANVGASDTGCLISRRVLLWTESYVHSLSLWVIWRIGCATVARSGQKFDK